MNLAPATIATILSDLLDTCVAAYGQPGAPDLPARQFVTHGTPVAEGEQLTVNLVGLSATHPFPLSQLRAQRATVVGSVGVSIEVWRTCWPMPDVTSRPGGYTVNPAAWNAAALALAADAGTLWGWIAAADVNGGLLATYPTIGMAADVSISPMVPLGPNGGLAGFKLPMAIKLSVTGQDVS